MKKPMGCRRQDNKGQDGMIGHNRLCRWSLREHVLLIAVNPFVVVLLVDSGSVVILARLPNSSKLRTSWHHLAYL